MFHRATLVSLAAVAALAVARPTHAAQPSAPWLFGDIGEPAVPGSTDVGAGDVWTITGSGDDIWNYGDSFHYAYQPVKGDGSITARLLSRSGGNVDWAKTGLMIRENLSAGSPNVNFTMAPTPGLAASRRYLPDEYTGDLMFVGPKFGAEKNLFMRLQRVGNDITGFYSRDGQLWYQAGFSPQLLPSLPQEALFGLAVSSVEDGKLATGKFDQVSVQQGLVSPSGVQVSGADRTVVLLWRSVPGAAAYNLYRGPANATVDQLGKPLTAQPITGNTFTDSGDALVNGTPVTYAIQAVAGDGAALGSLVALPATPAAVPSSWFDASINENTRQGSVAIDPATGEITLRGSGTDIWNAGDQCHFLYRLMEGDGQVTVKVLSRPTGSQQWAKAGLMIRDSLDGSARNACLELTTSHGLVFQYRGAANENSDVFNSSPEPAAITHADLKTPITIRISRQGRVITTAYSYDDGKTFQTAEEPLTFAQDLPQTLYVGLAITSVDVNATARATFALPQITN